MAVNLGDAVDYRNTKFFVLIDLTANSIKPVVSTI